ncbi:hypothetical protein Taro_043482 [Colocasia esculenta]|uniref:Uncharacterized protein n=1 Tax=Colocasia esculenta TaxID=4460 RepID=A0A843WL93_COLES|nr:hypothetical protein [Colocasia esculenta]
MARLVAKKAPAGVAFPSHLAEPSMASLPILRQPWGWPPISGSDGGSAMKREEDVQLKAAKRGCWEAESEADGNHEEEAQWANVIGDIFKRRGEYVEALRWLHHDYEVFTQQQRHLQVFQLRGGRRGGPEMGVSREVAYLRLTAEGDPH